MTREDALASETIYTDEVKVAAAKALTELSETCFRATYGTTMDTSGLRELGVKSANAAFTILARVGRVTQAEAAGEK